MWNSYPYCLATLVPVSGAGVWVRGAMGFAHVLANPASIPLTLEISIMAFTPATTQPAAQNDSWKADAFLNFYIPSKDGGQKKLGAIPLKMSRANEKQLIEWLQADPENVQKLVNKIQLNFQSATPSDTNGFDLE